MGKGFFLILVLFFSLKCQKAKDCFSNPGKKIIVEYELNEFDTMVVNDVFFIDIVQDTVNLIKISGYEDFVNTTNFKIADNSLILDNNHRCPFAKPEKNKINIEIRVNKISRIKLNEASELKSVNTLVNDGEIGLIVNSKYNEVDLKLNVNTFYYWNTHLNGGKIFLTGIGENIKLWNTSLGCVDARNFVCQNAYVQTNSKTDCYINACNSIEVEIQNTGNVYYSGTPEIVIKYAENAKGRLIHF